MEIMMLVISIIILLLSVAILYEDTYLLRRYTIKITTKLIKNEGESEDENQSK